MYVCVSVCIIQGSSSPNHPDAVRKNEMRQEFIIQKYVALKFTTLETKERILEERELRSTGSRDSVDLT